MEEPVRTREMWFAIAYDEFIEKYLGDKPLCEYEGYKHLKNWEVTKYITWTGNYRKAFEERRKG